MTKKGKSIHVQWITVNLFDINKENYISLTDMARFKDQDRSDYVLQNWMRNYSTIEFLWLWEKINNKDFNSIDFDGFKNKAWSNSFSLTPKKWIESTNAIWIISKTWRYWGTYAHKDIAFEFWSWLSAEFKLFLIKEFQRLKEQEIEKEALWWDLKRNLAKVNYKIHTDAIKENLIPLEINKAQKGFIYANEADVLNVALFNMTAKQWREANPDKDWNIRDYATVEQLVVLSNIESFNAELIKTWISQKERLIKLNQISIYQMESLTKNTNIKKLK